MKYFHCLRKTILGPYTIPPGSCFEHNQLPTFASSDWIWNNFRKLARAKKALEICLSSLISPSCARENYAVAPCRFMYFSHLLPFLAPAALHCWITAAKILSLRLIHPYIQPRCICWNSNARYHTYHHHTTVCLTYVNWWFMAVSLRYDVWSTLSAKRAAWH